MDDEAPLAGVNVIELSMYVQGPVAGLTLASLGADVVKIEQVGRQPTTCATSAASSASPSTTGAGSGCTPPSTATSGRWRSTSPPRLAGPSSTA